MNKKRICIINGPNLNLLGRRKKSIYGSDSFEDWFEQIRPKFPDLDLTTFQSNVEGEIVTMIQQAGFELDGIIINAGAYTHTSVAIRDAIAAVPATVVEIHISNILTRESFRHESLIGPVCKGSIMGFGLDSYRLGILSFI